MNSHPVAEAMLGLIRHWLRVILTPANFATADWRDMLQLLLFVAVFEQGRAEHHHTHSADRIVGTDVGELVLDDPGLAYGQSADAIFFGPGRCTPTTPGHGFSPFLLHRGLVGRTLEPG